LIVKRTITNQSARNPNRRLEDHCPMYQIASPVAELGDLGEFICSANTGIQRRPQLGARGRMHLRSTVLQMKAWWTKKGGVGDYI